jgi:hypothetical protein
MTITRLGEVSLAAAVPLLATFKAALLGATGFAIPQLELQLLGLANVLAAITVAPPSLGATIVAAQQTVLQLQAAISGPTVTLQLPAIIAKVSELTASLGALVASAALDIPSGTVTAYVFDGASGVIGGELQAEVNATLPGAPGHANALILVTTSPGDWAACGEVFAV